MQPCDVSVNTLQENWVNNRSEKQRMYVKAKLRHWYVCKPYQMPECFIDCLKPEMKSKVVLTIDINYTISTDYRTIIDGKWSWAESDDEQIIMWKCV